MIGVERTCFVQVRVIYAHSLGRRFGDQDHIGDPTRIGDRPDVADGLESPNFLTHKFSYVRGKMPLLLLNRPETWVDRQSVTNHFSINPGLQEKMSAYSLRIARMLSLRFGLNDLPIQTALSGYV